MVSHLFIVTNAKYLGDPNANVFSYGENSKGNLGNVGRGFTPSGFSKATASDDLAFWLGSTRCGANGGFRSPSVSLIGASDSLVEEFARNLKEDNPYTAVPGLVWGVNSNSAAQAIANRSQGSRVLTPGGRWTPGASHSRQVNFGNSR